MSPNVTSVKEQEDACVFPSFDSDVAWELGSLIRARCQRQHPARPAVVYIALANNSQLLFFTASKPGTISDDMRWVKRKEAVVLRWGVSSLRMRAQMVEMYPYKEPQDALRLRYEIADPSAYACYGGGFPVRVKSVEGVVGVIVVSGLNDDDNHEIIVEAIREYLAPKNKQPYAVL